MSKFLLNLLLQISKALVYSKIKFYSKRNFSVTFGPSSLSAQPRPTSIFFPQPTTFSPFPTGPRPLGRPVGPVGHAPVAPCPLVASLTGRLLQPRRLCPSPRPADWWAPPVIPHLRLCPSSAAPPTPPATPHTAQLHTSGCHPEPLLAPPSLPLDFPLLTSPPSSMALKPLTPPLPSPATPPWRSPVPYKRAMRPPALIATHPLSPELLRALLHPCDELKPPPFTASGAPPLHHCPGTGEHLLLRHR
jgi:hypothetical protein